MSNSDKFKSLYRTIMLIIIVAIVTFILTSTFIYKKLGTTKEVSVKNISTEFFKKIYTIRKIIDQDYIYDIDEKKLTEGAIKGYVTGLGDKYSEYFTKEEMEQFKTETQGNYVGIGIYMLKNTQTNEVVILYPIEDSPAEKAGLLSGDVIKKVDDVEYTGEDFEKIATYIKGKEGTKVKIEVEREGKSLTFDVERKNIDLYPIKSEVLEENIGYINISSFDEKSSKEFKTEYEKLKKLNIKSLIIDLRNNGGGIVDEALKIADYALEKDNTILITKDKNGNEEIEKSQETPIITVPIVILVNNNTASASEILTAALKENEKAIVVGEKTYGKGVIQELIGLLDGSGIKITTEEYFTPNRNKIDKIGITPDKEVSLPDTVTNIYKIEKNDDNQLKEAINLLK